MLRGNGEGFELAHGHARGCGFKPLDNLAGTDYKDERLPADGCIKLKPVFQPAPIVNLHGIALLCGFIDQHYPAPFISDADRAKVSDSTRLGKIKRRACAASPLV
jgi:hypothetical protein